MDDAQLVMATCDGDLTAFTAIFDRHASRVHDLALAMLRGREAALEVVESSFLEASLRMRGLEQPHRLPVWLLAVTRRNAALRSGPTAGPDRQPTLPNDDPERTRLAILVWEAVADLPLRERTLIDLDLRHRLDGQDLADAMGVTVPQAFDLQARMRDRIEKGLSGYLIARTSPGRCLGLTKVLKGWDGRFTPKDAGRIALHVESCQVCNQIRFSLASPFELYASALPAPFPAAARPRVLERVVLPGATAGMTVAPILAVPDEVAMPYQYPLSGSPSSLDAAPLPQAGAFSPDPAPAPLPAPLPSPAPVAVADQGAWLGPPTSPYQPAEPGYAPTPYQPADPGYAPSPYQPADPGYAPSPYQPADPGYAPSPYQPADPGYAANPDPGYAPSPSQPADPAAGGFLPGPPTAAYQAPDLAGYGPEPAQVEDADQYGPGLGPSSFLGPDPAAYEPPAQPVPSPPLDPGGVAPHPVHDPLAPASQITPDLAGYGSTPPAGVQPEEVPGDGADAPIGAAQPGGTAHVPAPEAALPPAPAPVPLPPAPPPDHPAPPPVSQPGETP